MTTAIPTQPLTTSVFLFGETQASAAALAHALDQHGVLSALGSSLARLSQAGREAAGGQVATAAQGLLDLDLGDLIAAGWRKHAALTAVAERTVANPGSLEVVDLATHHITSVHRPSIDLLVNDVHVATVRFELRVEFVVKGLVATVRRGHLVALHSGICDVTATLAGEGRQLVTRRAQLQLPLILPLGNGVPLLRDM